MDIQKFTERAQGFLQAAQTIERIQEQQSDTPPSPIVTATSTSSAEPEAAPSTEGGDAGSEGQ